MNVRHVSCLGRCDLAPAIAVNDQIFEKVNETDASTLIDFALAGASPEQLAARRAHPHRTVPACWRAQLSPFATAEGKSRETRRWWLEREARRLRSSPQPWGTCRACFEAGTELLTVVAEACRAVFGQAGTGTTSGGTPAHG